MAKESSLTSIAERVLDTVSETVGSLLAPDATPGARSRARRRARPAPPRSRKQRTRTATARERTRRPKRTGRARKRS